MMSFPVTPRKKLYSFPGFPLSATRAKLEAPSDEQLPTLHRRNFLRSVRLQIIKILRYRGIEKEYTVLEESGEGRPGKCTLVKAGDCDLCRGGYGYYTPAYSASELLYSWLCFVPG